MVKRREEYVVIVGGTNIDIQGFPKNKLILRDSNVGNVKLSLGGVGRNIGDNLVRLGVSTKLISVIGDDPYGNMILETSKDLGLDLNNSLVVKGQDTSIYLSILDEAGDMEIAISSMDIYDRLDIDFIKEQKDLIEGASLCIIDANIRRDVIEYILDNFKGVDFFLDTVSTAKTEKVKDLVGRFHTIKPNRLEVEILTGIRVETEDDLRRACEYLHEKGVKNIFISLGEDGVFYSDASLSGHKKVKKLKIVNATGAGDAFVAAMAYGYIRDMKIEEVVDIAMAASAIALSHEDTINPYMSIETIKLKIKENELC